MPKLMALYGSLDNVLLETVGRISQIKPATSDPLSLERGPSNQQGECRERARIFCFNPELPFVKGVCCFFGFKGHVSLLDLFCFQGLS